MRRSRLPSMRLVLSMAMAYVVACLVAPLVGAIGLFLFAASSADTAEWADIATFFPSVLLFILTIAPMMLAVTMPFALPVIVLLEVRHVRQLWVYALSGLAASLPLAAILAWSWPIELTDVALGGIVLVCGFVGGVIYRLVRRVTFNPGPVQPDASVASA